MPGGANCASGDGVQVRRSPSRATCTVVTTAETSEPQRPLHSRSWGTAAQPVGTMNTNPHLGTRAAPQRQAAQLVEPDAAMAAAEVERCLVEWLPVAARALDPEVLAVVEPSARSAVSAAAARTVADVRRMLRASFGITAWALEELGFLAVETTWHPDSVRRFVDEANAHRSVDWRQQASRTLNKVGRAVNPQFWPVPTQTLSRTGAVPPYSAQVEEALAHAAILLGRPGRTAELAVASLSLGGGLDAPRIAVAGPGDVIELGGGRLGVRVRGPHERVTPIRDAYTELVRRAVRFADGELFVTARSRNAVYKTAGRVMVHGVGHLGLARARSTWLRAHLVAGTPLAALRAIAGPLSLNTLNDLLGPAAEEFAVKAAAVEGLRA